jgi:predicted enzyme related to lactoylglutathione lyase
MAETRLKAQLVLCNVPTSNSEAALGFYGALLGSDDFVRGLNDEVESYFRPLSQDGIDLTVTQRYDDQERLTCYFAVESLDDTLQELSDRGGKTVVEPREVHIGPKRALEFYRRLRARDGIEVDSDSVGRIAFKHFRLGEYQRPLDDDQVKGLEEARRAAD